MKPDFPHASNSFKRRNPHLFLGQLETDRTEQASPRALDEGQRKRSEGQAGLVARIVCISLRKRLLDPDATAFSMKPLTDSIARSLGIDDADPRVDWEYLQAKSCDREGVVVMIQML